MISARSQLAAMPLVSRFAVVGAIVMGAIGGLVGLILGLLAYPATAWFAVLEVGVPAAIAGGLVGSLVGVVTLIVQHRSHP
jgi:hypothetical protein